MLQYLRFLRCCRRAVEIVALVYLTCSTAFAQLPGQPLDSWPPPAPGLERGQPAESLSEAEPPTALGRPRFFRVPLALRTDSAANGPADDGQAGGRLQVQFGPDYLFEVRRPGDPGGVGYQRLNTQFQLIDNGTSGVVVGLQALRPSGMEFDGLNEGPTVVRPSVGLFQEFGDGKSLQGFVGKDVRPGPQWSDNLDRNVQYGMAVQTPLSPAGKGASPSVFFFLEALGHYRPDRDPAGPPAAAWEVVPGLHWRNADNWWLSSGVLVPVGPGRGEGGILQFSCGMQF